MSSKNELFKYIIARLALLPIMLWIISSMVFILLRIAPGDPVDAILGTRANELARESLRMKLGLNKPLINQYFEYLNHLIHGDLGTSLNTQEPVKVIISKSLPASIELVIFAILIASLLGYLIGFLTACYLASKIKYSDNFFMIFFKLINLLSPSSSSLFSKSSCTLLSPQKLPLNTASPLRQEFLFISLQLNKGAKYAIGSGKSPVQSNITASKEPFDS